MLDWFTIGFLLIFAITLLLIGFFKNQSILILFAGITFILIGLAFFNNNIYYKSGYYSTEEYTVDDKHGTFNHTDTETNYTYAPVENVLIGNENIRPLGILFTLFGLFLLFIVGASVFSGKTKLLLDDDDDD